MRSYTTVVTLSTCLTYIAKAKGATVTWVHVKAHVGHPWNAIADAAAGAAPKVPPGSYGGAKHADSFCTCLSIGNQVDGLPIALSTELLPS